MNAKTLTLTGNYSATKMNGRSLTVEKCMVFEFKEGYRATVFHGTAGYMSVDRTSGRRRSAGRNATLIYAAAQAAINARFPRHTTA